MDIVEFAEKICGIKLLDIQKEMLREYEKMPPKCKQIIYKYNNALSRLPRKCFFCEFDKPFWTHNGCPQCGTCHKYSNFQVKKRMSYGQECEWEVFKLMKGE